MAEKPLPPEENTGLANALKIISKAARTNPVVTGLQALFEPKTVADATLTPEMREAIREYNEHGEVDGLPPPMNQDLKEVSKKLPKFKRGLKSVKIEEDVFKDILKTSKGDPIVLYRGVKPDPSVSRVAKKSNKDMVKGKSRKGYATFLSDNPSVAESYAGTEGVIVPFIVKPKKVIVYEDKYTRNLDQKNSISFDKFEFDRQAKMLGPGEVLVARNVYDAGPRVIKSGPDDPKYWSYGSDLYAVKDETVLLPAINPKLRYAGGSVMERNPHDYQPRAI